MSALDHQLRVVAQTAADHTELKELSLIYVTFLRTLLLRLLPSLTFTDVKLGHCCWQVHLAYIKVVLLSFKSVEWLDEALFYSYFWSSGNQDKHEFQKWHHIPDVDSRIILSYYNNKMYNKCILNLLAKKVSVNKDISQVLFLSFCLCEIVSTFLK